MFSNVPMCRLNIYLDVLQLCSTSDWHLQPQNILEQDGAPCHCGFPVRMYHDEEFLGRWSSSEDPLLWPPRSLDINHWTSSCGVISRALIIITRHRTHDLKKNITTAIWLLVLINSLERGKNLNTGDTLSVLRGVPILRFTKVNYKLWQLYY